MRNLSENDTLILFAVPTDFSSRTAYQSEIDSSLHKLAKILGGYHFGKNNYIPCGLQGCSTLHGKGYVVQTLDGIETNTGKDCGKKTPRSGL